MAVEQMQPSKQGSQVAARSETRFPAYDLLSSLGVADVIHKQGGGTATAEHLSSYLDYKGVNNGAYLARVSAARAFGFIQKVGDSFAPTPLARQILAPVYDVDAKKALVDAFLNVPLYKRIYEDFRGKELPPGLGMKNALRLQYGILGTRVETAYKVLMDSAEQAGFFATRAGAKTHLIIPAFPGSPSQPNPPAQEQRETTTSHGGGGNSGGGSDGRGDVHSNGRTIDDASSTGMQGVKAKYLSTLIKLFEDKSAKGDLDEKLMERIERLLGDA
jgi:hypothetical protein